MPSMQKPKSIAFTATARKSQILDQSINFFELNQRAEVARPAIQGYIGTSKERQNASIGLLVEEHGTRASIQVNKNSSTNFNKLLKVGCGLDSGYRIPRSCKHKWCLPTYSFISKDLCWVFFGKTGDSMGAQFSLSSLGVERGAAAAVGKTQSSTCILL